jgi:hypothetical protein
MHRSPGQCKRGGGAARGHRRQLARAGGAAGCESRAAGPEREACRSLSPRSRTALGGALVGVGQLAMASWPIAGRHPAHRAPPAAAPTPAVPRQVAGAAWARVGYRRCRAGALGVLPVTGSGRQSGRSRRRKRPFDFPILLVCYKKRPSSCANNTITRLQQAKRCGGMLQHSKAVTNSARSVESVMLRVFSQAWHKRYES